MVLEVQIVDIYRGNGWELLDGWEGAFCRLEITYFLIWERSTWVCLLCGSLLNCIPTVYCLFVCRLYFNK